MTQVHKLLETIYCCYIYQFSDHLNATERWVDKKILKNDQCIVNCHNSVFFFHHGLWDHITCSGQRVQDIFSAVFQQFYSPRWFAKEHSVSPHSPYTV